MICAKRIIFFSLVLYTQFVSAQRIEVNYRFNSSEDSLQCFKDKKTSIDNEDELFDFLEEREALFQKKGYLLLSYSTKKLSSQQFEIKINFKRKFDHVILNVSQIPDFLLHKTGFISFSNDTIKITPK